jgi:glycosyltransferase involved in cell wall biosynthesis
VKTVYHGLPADLLTPSPVTPSYLAFLGRISPEKRVDRAVRIARACGIPLKIAAKVDRVDRDYFEETIRPLFDDGDVDYVGEIGDAEKSEFLSGAIALLAPVDWPEPFGLAMIEAMACGTPVIAFDRGSIPEVVDDGMTGFVVATEEAAIDAVGQLSRVPRDRVRRRFEERFTARRMALDYLAVYRQLIEAAAPRTRKAVGLRVLSDTDAPALSAKAG